MKKLLYSVVFPPCPSLPWSCAFPVPVPGRGPGSFSHALPRLRTRSMAQVTQHRCPAGAWLVLCQELHLGEGNTRKVWLSPQCHAPWPCWPFTWLALSGSASVLPCPSTPFIHPMGQSSGSQEAHTWPSLASPLLATSLAQRSSLGFLPLLRRHSMACWEPCSSKVCSPPALPLLNRSSHAPCAGFNHVRSRAPSSSCLLSAVLPLWKKVGTLAVVAHTS